MSELLWYQAAVTRHQDRPLASPLPLPHPRFPHIYDSAHSLNHLPKNPHLKSASGQPSLKQLRGLNEIVRVKQCLVYGRIDPYITLEEGTWQMSN